jgi:hypothetical protein
MLLKNYYFLITYVDTCQTLIGADMAFYQILDGGPSRL